LINFAALERAFVDDVEVLCDAGRGGAHARAEVHARAGSNVRVVDADEQDGFALV